MATTTMARRDGNNNGDGNNIRKTPAPTPWTVPPFQPTTSLSSPLCQSPMQELPSPLDLRSDDGLGTSVALDGAGRILVAGTPKGNNLSGSSALDTGAAFVQTLVNANNGNFSNTALGKGVAKLVASDAHRWTHPVIMGE